MNRSFRNSYSYHRTGNIEQPVRTKEFMSHAIANTVSNLNQ